MPGGGLGFTRVPSLVSIWSTAPFLLNNRLGPRAFSDDPSVAGRMKVFDASIEQLLWPEKREKEPGFDGYIARTTQPSQVLIPFRNIPVEMESLIKGLPPWLSGKVLDPDLALHFPIPQGFPINILAGFQPLIDVPFDRRLAHLRAEADLLKAITLAAPAFPISGDEAARLQWVGKFSGPLRGLMKCPDFVLNRGHYFGTEEFNDAAHLSDDEKAFGTEPALSDEDKRALIAYLKTL
ncbi:MAG: hypothetical protein JO288_00685 [Hyphomicrobiales bacterium]|nr:hypothetical protein [Hyphomicrobiales bacterium]